MVYDEELVLLKHQAREAQQGGSLKTTICLRADKLEKIIEELIASRESIRCCLEERVHQQELQAFR